MAGGSQLWRSQLGWVPHQDRKCRAAPLAGAAPGRTRHWRASKLGNIDTGTTWPPWQAYNAAPATSADATHTHTHTHTHVGHLKSVHRWRQSAPPVALQDEGMWWEREIGGTVPREASRPPPVMLHPSSAAPSGCQGAASTTKLPATGLFIAAPFDIQKTNKKLFIVFRKHV